MKITNGIQLKGHYSYKVFDSKTGELKRQSGKIDNLIVLNATNGLYVVLDRLLGNTENDIVITSASIGTSSQAVSIGDEGLIEPVLENIPIALKSRISDGEISLTIFINDSELPNDTYNEFGVKVGNKLWARSIITPSFTKSTGEDIQIKYNFTGATT